MEVNVLEKKRTIVGDGFNFWVKIKAVVSTDKMEEMAKRVKEKSILEDYKKIQEAYDKSQKEIKALKKQLAATKTAQGRKKIKAEIAADEKLLQANEWFEKGYSSGISGNHSYAINAFSKAIELNPILAVAFNDRGVAYNKLGNNKQAIDDYNKAIELNPILANAYYNRGVYYNNLGNNNQAIDDYNKAIELSPKDADAYYNRGVAYNNLGNNKQAIDDYNKAIELNPILADAYYSRGVAYNNLGNNNQAINDYNKAIELSPKDAKVYVGRGNAFNGLGNYDRAMDDYNRAIELSSKFEWAYYNRGLVYHKRGNYNQAIDDYSKAIELNPKFSMAYNNRGMAYGKLGNDEQAVEDLKIAASLGAKTAQDVLKDLEKQPTNPTPASNFVASSERNLRIFQPGDYINYKVTGFVYINGMDVPIFGTAQYKVLDDTQDDHYGNKCKIFRHSMNYTVVGKERSIKISNFDNVYFTQDSNGSVMIHGYENHNKKTRAYVKVPTTGWHLAFKCPLNVHESVSQNIVYDDGSSKNGTDMVLSEERVSVPAGVFNSVKTISNTLITSADSGKMQNMETTWLVPKIGPIRSNLEYSYDKGSTKFILEMTDTNIPYQ
jgi:tetratricopeptide (TPR) repeat protein